MIKEIPLKPLPSEIESFVSQTMVLPTLEENTGIRVDSIFSFTPYEREAINRARKILLQGEEVSFASPEDLIIHKIFSGRPRDMEDARTVFIKNAGMDKDYIRHWLLEFDASSGEKKFTKIFQDLLEDIRE